MVSSAEYEYEKYRLLVLRRDQTEILLIPQEAHFELPTGEIPLHERVAENLCDMLKRKYSCEAVCLFSLSELLKSDVVDGDHYEVTECLQPDNAGVTGVWISLSSVTRQSFRECEEFAAIEQFMEKREFAEGSSTPFLHPGWFRELQEWVCETLWPLGLRLTGRVRQLNAGASFSLIRFETGGPAVWFKAVGEPNRHEFEITLKLAQLFPEFLPKVIGTRPDWNGWLTLEAKGADLNEARQTTLWQKAATSLARLQTGSLHSVNHILASGDKDLSAVALSASVDPFFNTARELMRRQTEMPPPILTDKELDLLQARIHDCLDRILSLAVPDALGHMDPNPGNIILSAEGCTFLDWAEAYVGNPFFTFQYLLEHLRRRTPKDRSAESRLSDTYIQEWKSVLSSSVINECLQLTSLVAVFAFAVGTKTWKDPETLKDSTRAGFVRSLLRRMFREANELNSRTPVCLC